LSVYPEVKAGRKKQNEGEKFLVVACKQDDSD
jgi:hypothetical protein